MNKVQVGQIALVVLALVIVLFLVLRGGADEDCVTERAEIGLTTDDC